MEGPLQRFAPTDFDELAGAPNDALDARIAGIEAMRAAAVAPKGAGGSVARRAPFAPDAFNTKVFLTGHTRSGLKVGIWAPFRPFMYVLVPEDAAAAATWSTKPIHHDAFQARVGTVLLTSGAATSTIEGWIPGGTVIYLEGRADLPGDQRQNVGNLIAKFPGFKDQASLDAKIDAAADATAAASMAKCFAGDAAVLHTGNAIQVFGGSGTIRGYEVERLYRDAKITQIYEGTNQIQRMIIARKLLGA